MWIRKHLAANLVAAGAALASMFGLWAVVRSDPPTSTDAASAPVATPTTTTARSTPGTAPKSSTTTRQVVPQRHTRTRAS
jgi:hypothetical protein